MIVIENAEGLLFVDVCRADTRLMGIRMICHPHACHKRTLEQWGLKVSQSNVHHQENQNTYIR